MSSTGVMGQPGIGGAVFGDPNLMAKHSMLIGEMRYRNAIYGNNPYAAKGADAVGNVPSVADLYKDVNKKLSGWGNQAQADLRQNYMNAMGMSEQSLASSGLSGTTIAPSMRMGYMRQYQQAVNRLNDEIQRMKVGYQTQIGLHGAQMAQQNQQFQQQLGYQYSRVGLS